MNTRIAVDHFRGDGSAWTAAVREPDQVLETEQPRCSPEAADGDPHANSDRVSVDPLRATDRYRLVAPLPLQF